MNAAGEARWLRALRVADARGLLPANRATRTPKELAAEMTRRGDDRLAQLVDGWYYPASYGGVRGALSDEDADRLVAALEAEVAPESGPPAVEHPPASRNARCDLCGSPLTAEGELSRPGLPRRR